MAQDKVMELFKAYAESKLPNEGGYIVSSFLDSSSAYAKYEVIAYSGVKNIYLSADGLTFQTDGNKIFVLAEPASYAQKHMEPYTRIAKDQIPHRFSELEILTSRNQTKVMVSKAPILTYGSFTVLKPTGINFSFVFYNLPDVFETVQKFFTATLNKEANVPRADAEKAAKIVITGMKKFTIWGK